LTDALLNKLKDLCKYPHHTSMLNLLWSHFVQVSDMHADMTSWK